jgi:hypothetical protein
MLGHGHRRGADQPPALDRRDRRDVVGLLVRAAGVRRDLEVVDLRPVELGRPLDDAGVDPGRVEHRRDDLRGRGRRGVVAHARRRGREDELGRIRVRVDDRRQREDADHGRDQQRRREDADRDLIPAALLVAAADAAPRRGRRRELVEVLLVGVGGVPRHTRPV